MLRWHVSCQNTLSALHTGFSCTQLHVRKRSAVPIRTRWSRRRQQAHTRRGASAWPRSLSVMAQRVVQNRGAGHLRPSFCGSPTQGQCGWVNPTSLSFMKLLPSLARAVSPESVPGSGARASMESLAHGQELCPTPMGLSSGLGSLSGGVPG